MAITVELQKKRLFDLAISLLGITLLLPLFILIGLLIRIDSPGSSIYRARRVGQHGRAFKLYKFRTMTIDADKQGPGITTADDKRVTRVGRLLRRTKLDELPQLLNVLKGEMSLVGPRPEDPRYVALYTPEQRKVLDVRPGITSLASVRYRNEEAVLVGPDWETIYVQQVMPEKLAIDLQYVAAPTLWRDIGILFRTLLALFR